MVTLAWLVMIALTLGVARGDARRHVRPFQRLTDGELNQP